MPATQKNAPKPTELADLHAIQGAMGSLRKKAARNLQSACQLCEEMIARLEAGEVPKDNHVSWCLAVKDADHDLRVLEQLAHVLACAAPVEFTSSIPTARDRKATGKKPVKKVPSTKMAAKPDAPEAGEPEGPTAADVAQAIDEAMESAGNAQPAIAQLQESLAAAEASLEAFLATDPDFTKQYPNKKRRAYRKAIADAKARLDEALAAAPAS